MEFREQITIGVVYFVFAVWACLGFWQLVATWQRLKALSWLGKDVKSRWGYLLGSVVMAPACLWFFGTRSDEIFSPGPASSEVLFFLSASLLCALLTTILVSLLMDRLSSSREGRGRGQYPLRERVSVGGGRGGLYLPGTVNGLCPAVCAVSAMGDGIESLEAIAASLTNEGLVVLAVEMVVEDSSVYPDILALIPKAIAYLEGRDEVDSDRIGALGVGLAGDLAIRAAASDMQIRSVVVLAPLLAESSTRPGLDLIREMSYPEAIRWSGLQQGGALVTGLGAMERIPELDPQSLLIIYGDEDRLIPLALRSSLWQTGQLKLIPERGHRGLVRDARVISSTVHWFSKSLKRT